MSKHREAIEFDEEDHLAEQVCRLVLEKNKKFQKHKASVKKRAKSKIRKLIEDGKVEF